MNQDAANMGAESDLKLLGASKTDYPTHPDQANLETIPNRFESQPYEVALDCPEFTAVCPKTGQPDFATIVIRYKPRAKLIESKALKLYLFSFRNVGMFHEFVVNRIARDLFNAMEPEWIEVTGNFMPRGGISIIPKCRLDWPVDREVSKPSDDKSSPKAVPMCLTQSQLFLSLGKPIERIEACGGSPALTNAVCLAADIKLAVGDE